MREDLYFLPVFRSEALELPFVVKTDNCRSLTQNICSIPELNVEQHLTGRTIHIHIDIYRRLILELRSESFPGFQNVKNER